MNFIKKYFVLKSPSDKPPKGAIMINLFIVLLLFLGLILKGLSNLDYELRWDNILKYKDSFISGFITTIIISVLSLILSTILGMFFGIFGNSRFLPLRALSKIYVEIIRGTPLIVQILIFFLCCCKFYRHK